MSWSHLPLAKLIFRSSVIVGTRHIEYASMSNMASTDMWKTSQIWLALAQHETFLRHSWKGICAFFQVFKSRADRLSLCSLLITNHYQLL